MPSLECKHPCCSGEKCRKKVDKPKKIYVLKKTPLKKKPYKIKKVADKRMSQLQEYSAQRKEFLKRNPICKVNIVGCTKKASEVHHMKGKENEKLNEIDYWMPICRNCHTYITINSAWAIDMGFSVRRIT